MVTGLLPDWVDREVVCFVLAAVMVTAGTLATGIFPARLPFQLLAGGLILAAFALLVVCLKDEDAGVESDR